MSKRVKARMAALLDNLDYDFSQFTLTSFVHWIEQVRGREIIFIPYPMSATLFGAWIEETDAEYVFFDQDALEIHQAHIQLHEIAHMLCGHRTARIRAGACLTSLKDAGQSVDALLMRSVHSSEEEEEAEMLTALIQERVRKHARLAELHQAISSEGDFATYFATYIEELQR